MLLPLTLEDRARCLGQAVGQALAQRPEIVGVPDAVLEFAAAVLRRVVEFEQRGVGGPCH
jgi:hypothetical protein